LRLEECPKGRGDTDLVADFLGIVGRVQLAVALADDADLAIADTMLPVRSISNTWSLYWSRIKVFPLHIRIARVGKGFAMLPGRVLVTWVKVR